MAPQKSQSLGSRRQVSIVAAGAAPTRLEERHLKKQQQRLEVERAQEVQEKGPFPKKKTRRSEPRPKTDVKSRKQRRAATSEVRMKRMDLNACIAGTVQKSWVPASFKCIALPS